MILGVMAFYIISMFTNEILIRLYYVTDTNYLLVVVALVLLPLLIAFVIVMVRNDHAYELTDDKIKVYAGKRQVFESKRGDLIVEPQLIRNTRSFSKDYLQMQLTLKDSQHAFEGVSLDLKLLGTSLAFKLIEALNHYQTDTVIPETDTSCSVTPSKTYTLTGRKYQTNETQMRIIGLVAYAVMFLFLMMMTPQLADYIGLTMTVTLILLIGLSPLGLLIVYQVSMQKNLEILNVHIEGDTLYINDDSYPLDSSTILRIPYPDSLVSRMVKLKIIGAQSQSVYQIKRNPEVPKDDYYQLYHDLAISYPNNIKIQ